MRQSITFIPTLREVPQDVENKTCQMLIRAGYIRHQGGTISYLPLAKRVLNKIEHLLREEFEALGAVEMELPSIGEVGMSENCDEGLSHVTRIIGQDIQSYKNLPIILYAMQTIIDDHGSPFPTREWKMLSAYSFHGNRENLQETLEKMTEVIQRIATRLGLPLHQVETHPTGVLDWAQALIVFSKDGDETIATSNQSNFKASITIAPVVEKYPALEDISFKALEKVATPGVETIKDVCEFFKAEPSQCIKTLVVKADGKVVVALVRGDHLLSLHKLAKVLHAKTVEMAKEEEIQEAIGCSIGSLGPIKLPIDIEVYADYGISSIRNGISGANEDGYHYINVNPERDFAINTYADLRYIQEGDPSPDGQGEIELKKAMKIGNISAISQNFSEQRKAIITNEEGKSVPMHIGYYQMGVTQLFASLAEMYHDYQGFIWPMELAPYDIHLMAASSDELQVSVCEQIYHILTTYRYNVLYDDRNKSAGVKFSDADLIGLPVRVVVGKKVLEGFVEVTVRKTRQTFECAKEELIDRLNELFSQAVIR